MAWNLDEGASTTFIVSTSSGTSKAEAYWNDQIKPLLAERQLKKYKVYFTRSSETIKELTRDVFLPKANSAEEQNVVLLSGDGGIVDMLEVLYSSKRSDTYRKPTVALIALGTGNALAHSSDITRDSTLGLSTLTGNGTARALPTFRVRLSRGSKLVSDEGRKAEDILPRGNGDVELHGAVVCSWGLHASLVADSDTAEYRKHGVDRFKVVAGELLTPADGSPSHRYRGKVSLLRSGEAGEDWKPLEQQEHMYVLTTLVSNLEEKLVISPFSRPLDGQLRLVHWGPLPPEEVMPLFGKAYDGGKHVDDEKVGYEAVEGVRIEFDEPEDRWRRICIDGKIVMVSKGGWVEIRREKTAVLDLVVPAES